MFLTWFLHFKRFLIISLTFVKAPKWGHSQELKYARIHFGNAPTFEPCLPQTTLICLQQIV